MQIERDPDASLVASFLGVSSDRVIEGDRIRGTTHRWLAIEEGQPVAEASTFVRVDDRRFVTMRGDNRAAEALLRAAVDELTGPLYMTIKAHSTEQAAAARANGFVAEAENRSYLVPVDAALRFFEPIAKRLPAGIDLRPVDVVDPDRLFALDTELRNDVPGNDGWRGNRVWFDDELASPECDPQAYPVAVDRAGELIGLCRIWRNDDGPSLGMLGVRRSQRNGVVAAALAASALDRVQQWGDATFTTHTAHVSLQRRLIRLGATETDRGVRYIRQPRGGRTT